MRHPTSSGTRQPHAFIALALVREAGAGGYSYLNVAIADGDHAVVSRFTDDPEAAPESLYWFTGSLYQELPDQSGAVMRHAVTVSSERLTADPGWAEVPSGQIIILRRDLAPQFMPVIAREGSEVRPESVEHHR